MTNSKSDDVGSIRRMLSAKKYECLECGYLEADARAAKPFCPRCGHISAWREWLPLIVLDLVCLVFTVLSTLGFVRSYSEHPDSFLFGFLAAFLAVCSILAIGLSLNTVKGLIGSRRRYQRAASKTRS
jgi:hypothetical protein